MFANLRRTQSGFTILELLVVIVFIGILAVLVFNTYGDVRRQNRNQERRADIEALHGQLEIYYAQNDVYPLESQATDPEWVVGNLRNLDTRALADPLGESVFTITTEPGEFVYAYQGIDCNEPDEEDEEEVLRGCEGYVLTATFEGEENGETTFVKQSLEGPAEEADETGETGDETETE